MNEMIINGEVYIRKDSIKMEEMAEKKDDMQFCIVRTYSAGVFAGYVAERIGKEIALIDSIRLWQWFGASLSQLSQEGTPDASKCKFSMTEKIKYLTEAIEITPCTEKARINLQSVPQWKI